MRKEIDLGTDFVFVPHSSTCSLKAVVCNPLIVSGMELASLSARLSLLWARSASPHGRKAGSGSLNQRLKKSLRKFSYNLEVYFVNKSSLIIALKLFCLTSKYFQTSLKSHFFEHRQGMALSKAVIITTHYLSFKKAQEVTSFQNNY